MDSEDIQRTPATPEPAADRAESPPPAAESQPPQVPNESEHDDAPTTVVSRSDLAASIHEQVTVHELPGERRAPAASGWAGRAASAPGEAGGAQPGVQPAGARAQWGSASTLGPASITLSATSAAGLSYLFWWLSALLIYFSERQNRYVRFHAVQSLLLTSLLTIFGVLVYTANAILTDLTVMTGQLLFASVGRSMVLLAVVTVLLLWLAPMIAAFTGHYLRLPIVGDYAERYAAPEMDAPPGREGE